jgi:hypothetical protein
LITFRISGTLFAEFVFTRAGRLAEAGRVSEPYSEILTMSTKKIPVTTDDAIKDPHDWTTGDEPMTGAQDSYLHTLARKAGEAVEDDLTKAEASMKIDELRAKTGVDDARPKPKRKARK